VRCLPKTSIYCCNNAIGYIPFPPNRDSCDRNLKLHNLLADNRLAHGKKFILYTICIYVCVIIIVTGEKVTDTDVNVFTVRMIFWTDQYYRHISFFLSNGFNRNVLFISNIFSLQHDVPINDIVHLRRHTYHDVILYNIVYDLTAFIEFHLRDRLLYS